MNQPNKTCRDVEKALDNIKKAKSDTEDEGQKANLTKTAIEIVAEAMPDIIEAARLKKQRKKP